MSPSRGGQDHLGRTLAPLGSLRRLVAGSARPNKFTSAAVRGAREWAARYPGLAQPPDAPAAVLASSCADIEQGKYDSVNKIDRVVKSVYLVHGIVLALLNVRTGGGKNGRWRVRRLG